MRQKIRQLIDHPLISGSTIMVFGSLSASFFSYLYHLIMGRLLGPSSYGELAAIVSLVGLIGILPMSLGLVVTKFVASAQEHRERRDFISYFYKRLLVAGVVCFLLLLLSSSVIASFLKIKHVYLLTLAFSMFLFFIPSTFLRSTLQGFLKFKEYVYSSLGENFLKMVLATLFVLVGFGVTGATVSLSLGSLGGLLVGVFYLKGFLKREEKVRSFNLKPVTLFALPVLIQSIATSSMYSSDLLLVKHFFSSFDAGLYAALSFLGRVIFFGASPIASAMFPLVSKKYSSGESYHQLFVYSLLATLVLSLGVLLIYGLVPSLAIKILYGSAYLGAAHLLLMFDVFITIFTLSVLFLNFFLAIGKVKVVIVPVVTALLQVAGILLFHSSLVEVIGVSLICSGILFTCLLSYYLLSELGFTK